ncbi:MAG: tyrosine-protein phosphatase [Bdellovibrionales bacterium]|nr:tyrosine-protein phosphatase [Bdellovibrionales bacterium]
MKISRVSRVLVLLLSLGSACWMPAARAEIVRFNEVEPGKVYRGGKPENYQDLLALKNLGVRTILNLRNNRDYVEWQSILAESLGMRVINRPTASLFSPTDRHVDEIQAMLNNPELQPVFIHCKHGKDRTGLMIGLYRVETQGWTPERAYSEMRAIGFNPVLFRLYQYFWNRTEPYSQRLLVEASVF